MKVLGRMFTIVVITAAAMYVLLCVCLFVWQRALLYFPQPRTDLASSTLLTISSGDERVEVSTRSRSGPAALLYFGGNAEDVSQEIGELGHTFPERAIYALHYPGYGGSSGKPSERAIFAAAVLLYDRVHAEHPDIAVIGRSLGSGVAVWLASQRSPTRLILVTPFDSLVDAAAHQHPYLPVRLLMRDKYDSWRYAPNVTAPVRIIVAENDHLIPRSSSERLRGRFRQGLVSYAIVPGAGHNDLQNYPQYWELLKSD